MKKFFFLSFFVLFFSFTPLVAEFSGDLLSKPHRIFEFGIDFEGMFANSSFGLKDVLKKNIEIDLKKIASDMPAEGFKLGFYNRERTFVNLNLSSRFRFGFFAGVEANSYFNVSKDLFDLLADGISVGNSKTVDVSGYADVFVDTGVSFQTIISGYGVKISPTYFVPLAYVPKTTATASLTTDSSGLIRGEAYSKVDVYTAISMEKFMEDEKKVSNLELQVADILSHGGFDFSLEIERNWFHNFNAGLYSRLPVVAGTLNYKMSTIVYADFYEDNLLNYLKTQEKPKNEHGHVKPSTYNPDDHEAEEEGFEYSEETYKVHRPLKLGLNATYMPFGEWLKIQPSLGFAVRNPYSSSAIFYPEYALDVRLALLWKILNFNVGTAYQNQIFQQRVGFGLNFRAVEIIAQASFCGMTLPASFTKNGYGAFIGFRMGF